MSLALSEEYQAMLARAAARVRALSEVCGSGFWFLTDLHVPSNAGRSGPLLARLVCETGLRTVVCGGDIPEAFGSRADLDRSIARYREEWVGAVERAGGAFFPVHGNHDFTIRAAPDAADGITYPAAETRAILLDTAAVRGRAVACPDAPDAVCYYADLPEARLRLVVADTHEGVAPDRPWWGVADAMSARQLAWLAGTALGTAPAGWGVVAVQHAPPAGVAATAADRERLAPWSAALSAAARRGVPTLSLGGHHHAEGQSCVDGVWHAMEPCDAAYLDYISRSLPWCPDLPEKRPGSPWEQTFDAVQLDLARGLAHFTRVGGGADRTLHLSPVRLAVGETRRFEAPHLPSVARWGAYDGDRASLRPDPERRYGFFTDYLSGVGSVSPDGVFAARAPGDAVVAALAPGGAKELFAVRVIP